MSIPPFFVLAFLLGKLSLTSIIFVNNEFMMAMTIMIFTYVTRVFPNLRDDLLKHTLPDQRQQ